MNRPRIVDMVLEDLSDEDYKVVVNYITQLEQSIPDVYELKESNEKLTGMFKELESIVNKWED